MTGTAQSLLLANFSLEEYAIVIFVMMPYVGGKASLPLG
jgi:hypothetical protein